jgi:hypothetical protein
MISAVLLRDIETYAANFQVANPLLRRARNGEVTYATAERYLASIRYLLEHTPQFLALARARARATGQFELATYFDLKLGEEAGHVEWAEADLERLSALSGVTGPRRPARAVVELMRVVREAIEDDPLLYLPYILFSEYFTVLMGPEWLSVLQERCGIPVAAMTAVSRHVELDKHHVKDGCREIDSLTRDQSDHAPLRAVLSNTMRQFSAFCDELCAAA